MGCPPEGGVAVHPLKVVVTFTVSDPIVEPVDRNTGLNVTPPV